MLKHQCTDKVYPFNSLNGLYISCVINGFTRSVYHTDQRINAFSTLNHSPTYLVNVLYELTFTIQTI